MAVTRRQWRWVVLVATMFGTTIADALINSPGVFLLAWKRHFGCSMAEVSIIAAANVFSYQLACLSGGHYLNALGYRKVVVIGGVASSVACLLSAFASSRIHLLLTFGLLSGITAGSTFPAFNVAIATYFPKNFSTIRGISCSGIAAGIVLLPPLLQYMIDLYGWSGALLVYSAVSGNVAVCGMILRPESAWKKLRSRLVSQKSSKASARNPTKNQGECGDLKKGTPFHQDKNVQNTGVNVRALDKEMHVSSSAVNRKYYHFKEKGVQDYGTDDGRSKKETSSSAADTIVHLASETNLEVSTANINVSNIEMTSSAEKKTDSSIGENDDAITGSDTVLKNVDCAVDWHTMTDSDSDANDVTRSITLAMYFRHRSCSRCMRFLKGGNYFLLTHSFSTILFLLTQFVCGICYNAVLGHLVPSVVYRGTDAQTAAFLMSFLGGGSFIARICNGFLIDYGVISASKLHMVSMAYCGVAVIFIRLFKSYWMSAISSIAIGAGSGSIISVLVVLPKIYVGKRYMGRAIGFAAFSNGVGGIIGTVVGGWLFDVTQNYDCVFYIFGGMLSAASFIYLLEPRIRRVDSERAREFIRKTLSEQETYDN